MPIAPRRRIDRLDLNLLLALEALLAELHVSRAAVRVGITQSAMSRSLARLRDELGDPILVRTGHGMRPTERARAIAGPLARALSELDAALVGPAAFVPATSHRTFRIGTVDYGSAVVLPAVLARVAREAPSVELVIDDGTKDVVPLLETGELDLVVMPRRASPAGMVWRHLLDERFVCVSRAAHPGISGRLTLATFCKLPHVVVTTSGRGSSSVDALLARRGLARHVALRIPSFLAAPLAVAGTDAIATTPQRIAHRFASALGLAVHRHPLPIPSFAISLGWHERSRSDPGHAWLREIIAAAAR